jgi:hypothetical protein
MYEIKNPPDIGFHIETNVNLINDKVENITIYFSADDADKMLNLLKKKYGKPKEFSTGSVQNRMGAKFNRVSAIWDIKDCEIFLIQRLSKIDDGYLFIDSKKYKSYKNEQKNKVAKDALDKL